MSIVLTTIGIGATDMKIAMIGQKGIPAEAGGVERHVEEIASRLVKRNHEVTVYCRSTYGEYSGDSYNGVRLKRIDTIENKNLNAIIYTFKATMDALKEGYDIIHYHAIGPGSLCFIPRVKKIKVIVTVHGLDWMRDKWGTFGKAYLKLGERISGKYANKIISVSKNLRKYVIDKYNRSDDDVIYIPNGVSLTEPKEVDEIQKYGLYKDSYILFLARLVPEKGAHYLIEAYKGIITEKKLVIAGGSSFTDGYVNELKCMAGDNKNIIFTGNVSGNLLTELYSNCFFYILPSDVEGMPITLLEAMSYKKCSLVSNIPENEEVVENGKYGVVFKKSNVMDLQSKILFMLDNAEYNRVKGEMAYQNIINRYNWDSIVENIVEVYR